MSDRAQQLWLLFNGTIYNHKELRGELESLGYDFHGHSDTEVLLNAYAEWGRDCIPRLNGMFAIAVWDARRNRLTLARDRYGIKPLYYGVDRGTFLFGSEIKSLLAYAGRRDVDLLALNEYFSFQNVFSDRTLFDGVKLLPPGRTLEIDVAKGDIRLDRYWTFSFTEGPVEDDEEVKQQLYHLIGQAVRRQCIGDVEIGSYLSGGMDSGAVAAITAQERGRITTFTAGFDLSEAANHEMSFDERPLAERMASALQTRHYECVLHAGDMAATMDHLIWHLEDLRLGQCYPNALVAQLAGKFVKVVMSGAGGDELFGGYPWRYAAAMGADSSAFVRNYYTYWQRLAPDDEKTALFTDRVLDGLTQAFGGRFATPGDHAFDVFMGVFGAPVSAPTTADQINYSLFFECKTFLHGLLVVEDKLSMAHGLETRVPFLDNDLVDFACRIPARLKLPDLSRLRPIDENTPRKKVYYQDTVGLGKNILRQAMERILPPSVTRASKQGFSAPDESWFRGRSEAYVRDTLLASQARLHDYIRPDYIRAVLDRHGAGKANMRLLMWSLLSLEVWLRQFQAAPPGREP